jgi:GntR family transcriptional regulator
MGALNRMDDRPPYRQIADQLRAAIERGELRPGDKLPSEAALMDHIPCGSDDRTAGDPGTSQ